MASFQKRSGSWYAIIRRTGHKPISKTFPTKALAMEWARGIEQSMDAYKYADERMLTDIPLRVLIERYIEEFEKDGFGKNKTAVLKNLSNDLGKVSLNKLTSNRLMEYVKLRQLTAGGVTISIDLTYLKQVLTTAKYLWKIPANPELITEIRILMHYAGINTKSKERDRRPTQEELQTLYKLCEENKRDKVPYSDLIKFAIDSAMRLGEITSILWEDINHEDKTILIRNRKHPTEKIGNDQIVPLLGESYDIVMRQPKTNERIFPYSEKTVSSIFPRKCTQAGITDLRFHDFRHEGVSRLFERGYRIEQVALVSGHKDWKMLKRYTQIKAKSLHDIRGSNSI